jgi:hypothetical protein
VAIRFKRVTPAVLGYARKLWNDLYGNRRAPELFLQESAAFIEGIRQHFRLTTGDIVFVSPADTEPENQPEFSFDLAFGEGETGNLVLLETLRQMVDEVGNIVANSGHYLPEKPEAAKIPNDGSQMEGNLTCSMADE